MKLFHPYLIISSLIVLAVLLTSVDAVRSSLKASVQQRLQSDTEIESTQETTNGTCVNICNSFYEEINEFGPANQTILQALNVQNCPYIYTDKECSNGFNGNNGYKGAIRMFLCEQTETEFGLNIITLRTQMKACGEADNNSTIGSCMLENQDMNKLAFVTKSTDGDYKVASPKEYFECVNQGLM